MSQSDSSIIIYNTLDGKASVALYAHDGSVWMNQNQLAELFDTSIPNISMHISNILKERELETNSVIKDYLTTASDGKKYEVSVKERKDLTMRYWRETVDGLLNFQGKLILQGKGSISNKAMEEHVNAIYETFNARRKALAIAEAEQTDLELSNIEESIKQRIK